MSMAIEPERFSRLSPAEIEELERSVSRFETAWQSGSRPNLAQFLPATERLRLPVLRELVHVDLEFRRKAGESARPEEYLELFPELRTQTQFLQSLMLAKDRMPQEQQLN